MYPVIFFFLFTANFPFQPNTEKNIEIAFLNAKKGMYWGLSQSTAKRNLIMENLIDNDRVIAAVRVEKEVNGLHVESSGYNESCEVKISIYKSTDNLIKEGFLSTPVPDTLIRKSTARKKKKT